MKHISLDTKNTESNRSCGSGSGGGKQTYKKKQKCINGGNRPISEERAYRL